LGLAEDFADGEPICVILGDNIFESPIREAVDSYRAAPDGAMVLLKEVDDPERFGVAELREDRITSIVEKPSDPKSNLAVTGCYFYDGRVFEIVQGLSPSGRGELEITDVNKRYLEWGTLRHHVVSGWWTDAGTIPSLYHATQLVAAAENAPVLRVPEVGGGRLGPTAYRLTWTMARGFSPRQALGAVAPPGGAQRGTPSAATDTGHHAGEQGA